MKSSRMRRIAPAFATVVLSALVLSACKGPQPEAPADAPAPPVSAAAPKASPAQPGPFWETYHGSSSLDGVADIALPDALAPVWQADVGAPVLNAPVTGQDRICVADTKGGLHAFDWKGRPVWSKSLREPGTRPSQAAFDAPLALFGSTLLACTASGVVYALDAADGATRWETDTDLPILGTPNLSRVTVDGQVQQRLFVVDQSDGALQCLDFHSGRLLWVSEGVSRCDGSPGVNEEFAVFGSCASAIHVFSTGSKDMLREIPLDGESQVAGGVVLLGDSIFSCSRSGAFIHADARTGQTVWLNTDCDGESLFTPAVSGDWIAFTADDGVVYALDRQTGSLKWKQVLGSIPSSPVIARDKVLVGAGGTLHLLRLSDGEKLWSYAVSDEITSPAVAGSLIIVGSDDGTVTAFGGQRTG